MNDCLIHGVTGEWCTQECADALAAARRSHRCEDFAVEHGDEPRPNGELTIVTQCSVCGRNISSISDNVLRQPNHSI